MVHGDAQRGSSGSHCALTKAVVSDVHEPLYRPEPVWFYPQTLTADLLVPKCTATLETRGSIRTGRLPKCCMCTYVDLVRITNDLKIKETNIIV